MDIPDSIVICMEGWHVDDGDPEVRVGATWAPIIELQRAGEATPEDWWPTVASVEDDRHPHLVQCDVLDGLPLYGFVADVVAGNRSTTSHWTALRVGPYGFAVPGVYDGRVEGVGIFRYDTYIVEGDDVLAAVATRLDVVRIQRLRRRHQQRAGGTAVCLPNEPPTEVVSTREFRPAERVGESVTFLIHAAPTSAGLPS